jgi:hypothetical protein
MHFYVCVTELPAEEGEQKYFYLEVIHYFKFNTPLPFLLGHQKHILHFIREQSF